MLAEPTSMCGAFFDKPKSALALAAVLALSFPLQGCSTPAASLMDARAEDGSPVKGGTYLPVGVTPPPRQQPTMTADEQLTLRNELASARIRQELAVKASDRNDK
jgi:hypothetical protein